MESNTHTVDEIRQLYSILPSKVNDSLKKGDKIYADDDWKPELESILTNRSIAYTCNTVDIAGKNVHEIIIS